MSCKVCLTVAAVASLAGWWPAAAQAVNYSYPATYSGSTEVGGTVEFDTSADGSSVTRFAVAGVPSLCGLEASTTTGSIPIVNEAFSYSALATGVSFSGSFPAPRQATGDVSVRFLGFPSCSSPNVRWTATTTVPPRDVIAPKTTIKSGPSGTTKSHKATFKFKSNESGSTFQCKLDGKGWKGCRSPKTYKNLKEGRHTFRVRARDSAGNVDATPAKRTWSVKPPG